MRISLILFFLAVPFFLFAQKAEEIIQILAEKYPQEKVVIQYSKNEYIAGETIFFKAYVLAGYEPSPISTNLYVELYDKTKQLLNKKIIPLFMGSGNGSFTLPVSMAEDVYYVRAYTQWMLNFADRFQYLAPIRVYNNASMNSLWQKPVQWILLAVPEGGKMIAGEPTKLAVRLLSPGSLPASWSGQLVEKTSGEPVANVTVYNREIGQVQFTPQAGKAYKLVAKDANSNSREMDLPLALETGTALAINLSKNDLHYDIRFKGLPSKGAGYKLIGTIHNRLVFKAAIRRSAGTVEGSIKTDSFPAGVLRVTLFDEKETPVAERLCFLHQSSLATYLPEIILDTLSFAPKGRNVWNLRVDTVNWPSYAIRVSDAGNQLEDDFLSNVYITSDFSTPIHEASWYLQDVSSLKQEALNALLITETWDRFRWTVLLKDELPNIKFQSDNYLTYAGTVYAGRKLKPLRDINLVLQAKDSSIRFLQVRTDSSATFTLTNMIFTDTVKVYYQPDRLKLFEPDVKIDFVLENRFHPLRRQFPLSPWIVGPRHETDSIPPMVKKAFAQRAQELLLIEKSKLMEEVIVRTRARSAKEELDRKLSSPWFSSAGAQVFDFVNEDQSSALGYTNILNWLQGRVAGLRTTTDGRGNVIPLLRNVVVQVLLDEMPVGFKVMSTIPIQDIAMVKVMHSNVAAGGNGAIAVYTRRGKRNYKYGVSNLLTNLITGYASLPPFFTPDYSVDALQSVPDERPVLYHSMAPLPLPGSDHAQLFFYNNDHAKSYRLIITGFTQNGQLVYLNKIIR